MMENEYLDQKQINEMEEQISFSLEKNNQISMRKLYKYNLYDTFLPYSKDSKPIIFLVISIFLILNAKTEPYPTITYPPTLPYFTLPTLPYPTLPFSSLPI